MVLEGGHHPLHVGVVPRRQDLVLLERAHGVADGRGTRGQLPGFLACLLAFLAVQQGWLGPEHEVADFPAHDARPQSLALSEDIDQVHAQFPGDPAAALQLPLDLRTGQGRVAGVPCLDSVAGRFQRTGQLHAEPFGDGLDVRAHGHPPQALHLDEGDALAASGRPGCRPSTVSRSQKEGERLLQHEGQGSDALRERAEHQCLRFRMGAEPYVRPTGSVGRDTGLVPWRRIWPRCSRRSPPSSLRRRAYSLGLMAASASARSRG